MQGARELGHDRTCGSGLELGPEPRSSHSESEPLTSVHPALGSGLGIIFLVSLRLFDHRSRPCVLYGRDLQGPCQQGGRQRPAPRKVLV